METFSRSPAPTWWLVMTRPSGETKLPEPPELNRTLERRTCSSHLSVGSKSYFLSCARGGLLNNHMPSSPRIVSGVMNRPRRAAAAARTGIRERMSASLRG